MRSAPRNRVQQHKGFLILILDSYSARARRVNAFFLFIAFHY